MFDKVKKSLEKNHFGVYTARDTSEAKQITVEKILPLTKARSVSYGDSLTAKATGIFEVIRADPNLELIEVFGADLSREEKDARQREALQVDLFITGTNAVTVKGQLVNLDSLGNRVGGITFGPRNVLIMVGRNKIVPTLEDALDRVKHYAAPANTKRLNKNTPCVKTGKCEDCDSPDRICNIWTIVEKSKPKGRIQVILIDQDLGL